MMKKILKSKKSLVVILSLVLVLAMGISTTFVNSSRKSNACLASKEVEINILHTNDIHADVENLSYISQYKRETKNALWFDGGDATQGKPIATYTKGKAIVEILNAGKLDAAAVGNHEFDYGSKQLLKNAKTAKFPFLAANVKNEYGKELLKKWNNNGAYKIFKRVSRDT